MNDPVPFTSSFASLQTEASRPERSEAKTQVWELFDLKSLRIVPPFPPISCWSYFIACLNHKFLFRFKRTLRAISAPASPSLVTLVKPPVAQCGELRPRLERTTSFSISRIKAIHLLFGTDRLTNRHDPGHSSPMHSINECPNSFCFQLIIDGLFIYLIIHMWALL